MNLGWFNLPFQIALGLLLGDLLRWLFLILGHAR